MKKNIKYFFLFLSMFLIDSAHGSGKRESFVEQKVGASSMGSMELYQHEEESINQDLLGEPSLSSRMGDVIWGIKAMDERSKELEKLKKDLEQIECEKNSLKNKEKKNVLFSQQAEKIIEEQMMEEIKRDFQDYMKEKSKEQKEEAARMKKFFPVNDHVFLFFQKFLKKESLYTMENSENFLSNTAEARNEYNKFIDVISQIEKNLLKEEDSNSLLFGLGTSGGVYERLVLDCLSRNSKIQKMDLADVDQMGEMEKINEEFFSQVKRDGEEIYNNEKISITCKSLREEINMIRSKKFERSKEKYNKIFAYRGELEKKMDEINKKISETHDDFDVAKLKKEYDRVKEEKTSIEIDLSIGKNTDSFYMLAELKDDNDQIVKLLQQEEKKRKKEKKSIEKQIKEYEELLKLKRKSFLQVLSEIEKKEIDVKQHLDRPAEVDKLLEDNMKEQIACEEGKLNDLKKKEEALKKRKERIELVRNERRKDLKQLQKLKSRDDVRRLKQELQGASEEHLKRILEKQKLICVDEKEKEDTEKKIKDLSEQLDGLKKQKGDKLGEQGLQELELKKKEIQEKLEEAKQKRIDVINKELELEELKVMEMYLKKEGIFKEDM